MKIRRLKWEAAKRARIAATRAERERAWQRFYEHMLQRERMLRQREVFLEMEQRRQQWEQQRAEKVAATLKEQSALLLNLIPEWADSEVAKRESAEIGKWAALNGFSDDELRNVTMAHHVAALRGAMLYAKGRSD